MPLNTLKSLVVLDTVVTFATGEMTCALAIGSTQNEDIRDQRPVQAERCGVAMKVIDADSHVYEVEATWDHLPKEFQARRPLPITIAPGDAPYMGVDNSFWLIDGRAVQWTWGKGTVQIGCPLTSRHANMKV